MKKKIFNRSKSTVHSSRPFSIQRRIYYHSTDAGGSVYYAHYLRIIEEAIVELFKNRSIDICRLFEQGVRFATVQVRLQYASPAGYGDLIQVYPKVKKIGTSSLQFVVTIKKKSVLVSSASLVWVCIGNDFASRSLPDILKTRLS